MDATEITEAGICLSNPAATEMKTGDFLEML